MTYIKHKAGDLLEEPRIGQAVVADRAVGMFRIDNSIHLSMHRDSLKKHPWLLDGLEDLSTPCKAPYLYQIPLQLYICLGHSTRQIGTLTKLNYEEQWTFTATKSIKVYILQPHDPGGYRYRKPHAVLRQNLSLMDVRILKEDGSYDLYPINKTYGE